MQHVHNICNVNEQRLHLMQNIDIKHMQHRYAPNTTSVNNNCDIKKRLQT
jgi:hypothetical protein